MKREYRIGLYEKAMPPFLSWAEKLRAAKKAGYDFVEISIDETDEKLARLKMPKNERLALIQTMFDEKIPIRTMCLSGHRKYPLGSENPAARARSLQIMEDALDLAADLGVRIIQLAGYDVYYEQPSERTRELFLEGLAKSVEMAAARGVMLAFETMETEFMNTVEKAMVYVRKINSPYLGVYPDCGNITNAAKAHNLSAAADLERGRGAIAAVHLKETVPGKFREVPYGEGHVDFEEIIKTSFTLGVSLFVTEFWWTGQEDYLSLISTSKRFIDDKFAQAIG
ncbi:MAG: L-ribulose-5-phosphate 3-epimerase [Spirochaetaceae bacterium]|jgi:L-ribulose-5-phosphate 3-epimerase|nr:L-ribulose-5-phosphate 3-epimerase [Spirochaetaceae bacterium]